MFLDWPDDDPLRPVGPSPAHDHTNMSPYSVLRFFWKMFFWNTGEIDNSKKPELEHGSFQSKQSWKKSEKKKCRCRDIIVHCVFIEGGCPHPNGLLTVTQPLLYHIAIFIVSVFNCWTKRSCESRCVAPSAWKSYWPSLPSLFAPTLVWTLDRLDNAQCQLKCWQNINEMSTKYWQNNGQVCQVCSDTRVDNA